MIELLVTSSVNLTTGVCTRELTVRQDGVIQSQTPLSPVEYAQLVQQAQGVLPQRPAPTPVPTAPPSPMEISQGDFGEGDTPPDDEVESVEAVEPPSPPPAARRPTPPPSVLRDPVQVPPPGRTVMPAARPAPPAPGVGVPMPGVRAPTKVGKSAGRAPRTIGSMLREGMDGDEGPNASPVEASEL